MKIAMKNKIVALIIPIAEFLNELPLELKSDFNVYKKLFLSKTWHDLCSVIQTFKPTIIDASGKTRILKDSREPLSKHTVKDLIGVVALLNKKFENLEKLVPVKSLYNYKLKLVEKEVYEELGLETINKESDLLKLYYVFVFYHDIGKSNNTRDDHEEKGKNKFLDINLGLSAEEKEIVAWFIQFHGEYAKLAQERGKQLSQHPQNLSKSFQKMIDELKNLKISNKFNRVSMLKLMALFNVIEGIQSDQFSCKMIVRDPKCHGDSNVNDILYYYKELIKNSIY